MNPSDLIWRRYRENEWARQTIEMRERFYELDLFEAQLEERRRQQLTGMPIPA